MSDKTNHKKHIVIVTGLSGAGKSTAMNSFEDLGYFCIDNLPPAFAPKVVELLSEGSEKISEFCFGMDLRQKTLSDQFADMLSSFRAPDIDLEIIFLEAESDILIQRYSATRRIHPMAPKGSLVKGIEEERRILSDMRKEATLVLDTSKYTVYQLRKRLAALARREEESDQPIITILSFGFQNGLPKDADLVFDVRFLPNPYYIPHLKEKTGLDADVSEYVLAHDEAEEFLHRTTGLLLFLLPLYQKEGKSYVTIAVGCTGGRHRSVAIARELESRLRSKYPSIQARHRDKEKPLNQN